MSMIFASLYMKLRNHENLYQMISLAAIFIIVHALYELWIRPTAEHAAQLVEESKKASGEEADAEEIAPPWSGRVAITLKDYEQEACVVAMFWALAIMFFKFLALQHARMMFTQTEKSGQGNFLGTSAADIILPATSDWDKYQEKLEYVKQKGFADTSLYKAAAACIERFFTTGRVPEAAIAAQQATEIEAERQESELSIVRYLVWLIPSVGFIGTVRGIGDALGKAEEAVRGNIAPVTESLGVAFNSTLVALVISVFVMFLLHKLQEAQETMVLDSHEFCNQSLLRYMRGTGLD